jgi:hypothetical protein
MPPQLALDLLGDLVSFCDRQRWPDRHIGFNTQPMADPTRAHFRGSQDAWHVVHRVPGLVQHLRLDPIQDPHQDCLGRLPHDSQNPRLEYAATTRSSVLLLVQTNNEDERVDINLRFHWIPTIGDDVYVVWNSGYTTDRAARYRFPSVHALEKPLQGALVVKAVHRFRL